MLKLAGAVGKSPRRLKRFVNSYRILKASCDALEMEEFVIGDGESGTYPSAMMLLAVTTGAPQSAIDFLRAVADPNRVASIEDIDKLVDGLSIGSEVEAEAEYLRAGLQVYKERKQTVDEAAIRELRYWAPRVARFSFRSGRA